MATTTTGGDAGSPRSQKSPEAFRTISEVATELDVPQHVLRFWESKFAQVRPLKRGGGRRYYRPEDLVMLRHIRDLLYNDGYTIKGVQKLLKENGGKIEVAAAPTSGEATTLSADKSAALKTVLTELEDIQKLLS